MALHSVLQSFDQKWLLNNNVDNNNMIFSADDHVLTKLLRQQKGMVLKNVSQNFSASRGYCQQN